MAILWIGLAIGILIVIILIIKASKTNPQEVVGIETHCKRCGLETRGLKCPRCEKKSQSFGV